MQMQPVIYNAYLSSQTVTAKSTVTITVLADDIEKYTADIIYARGSNYELMSGQDIGVV